MIPDRPLSPILPSSLERLYLHEHYNSFFGEQEGDFSLVLNSVSAEKRGNCSRENSLDSIAVEKLRVHGNQQRQAGDSRVGVGGFTSWIGKLCGWKM